MNVENENADTQNQVSGVSNELARGRGGLVQAACF